MLGKFPKADILVKGGLFRQPRATASETLPWRYWRNRWNGQGNSERRTGNQRVWIQWNKLLKTGYFWQTVELPTGRLPDKLRVRSRQCWWLNFFSFVYSVFREALFEELHSCESSGGL